MKRTISHFSLRRASQASKSSENIKALDADLSKGGTWPNKESKEIYPIISENCTLTTLTKSKYGEVRKKEIDTRDWKVRS
jgi:hypothetical protein